MRTISNNATKNAKLAAFPAPSGALNEDFSAFQDKTSIAAAKKIAELK